MQEVQTLQKAHFCREVLIDGANQLGSFRIGCEALKVALKLH